MGAGVDVDGCLSAFDEFPPIELLRYDLHQRCADPLLGSLVPASYFTHMQQEYLYKGRSIESFIIFLTGWFQFLCSIIVFLTFLAQQTPYIDKSAKARAKEAERRTGKRNGNADDEIAILSSL